MIRHIFERIIYLCKVPFYFFAVQKIVKSKSGVIYAINQIPKYESSSDLQKQASEISCGVVSLLAVINYLGVNMKRDLLTSQLIKQRALTQMQGLIYKNAAKVINQSGLKFIVYSFLPLKKLVILLQLNPLIVSIKNSHATRSSHLVVVKGIKFVDEVPMIVYYDSDRDEDISLDLEAFKKISNKRGFTVKK